VNEKTTIYIEPELKEEVKIKLIREKENKSLSALINELLEKWLKNT
jgi:predicted CopG family antitoxin